LGVVSFLTDVSSEMIYPLLPIFLTAVLGAGPAFLGIIEGIAETTASLLKLYAGWLSDRLGQRKPIVVAGYALSALTRPLVALATAGWHVLLVRFLDRVGKGVRTSPRDALVAQVTPEDRRGLAYGFQRGMDHAGAIVGPLLAAALLAWITEDYRTVFWLAFIPGFLSVAVLVFFVHEAPRADGLPAPPTFTLRGFDGRFRRFLLVILIFTLGNSSDAFLLLRAHQLGVPLAQVPLLWILLHVAKAMSAIPGGMLSDAWGRRRAILAGWVIYAGVYLGLALAAETWELWVLFTAYGLFFGLTEAAERAYVADLVAESHRGTAYGAFHLMVGIGALPASVLMGVIWEGWGAPAAFAFGAALALLAAGLLLVLLRERVKGSRVRIDRRPESG
jgi:MFS family permease